MDGALTSGDFLSGFLGFRLFGFGFSVRISWIPAIWFGTFRRDFLDSGYLRTSILAKLCDSGIFVTLVCVFGPWLLLEGFLGRNLLFLGGEICCFGPKLTEFVYSCRVRASETCCFYFIYIFTFCKRRILLYIYLLLLLKKYTRSTRTTHETRNTKHEHGPRST